MVVAERVVDLLEAVEVDQQQPGEPAERPHAADDAHDALVQRGAVGEPGERVVVRLVAQPARGALDEREEREVEQPHAAAEQQVEHARVVVDRRRRSGRSRGRTRSRRRPRAPPGSRSGT